MTQSDPDHFSPAEEMRDIQGAVIGFNKDHLQMLFVTFADTATAKAAIGELQPNLATGWEVLEFNSLYGEIHQRGGDPATIQATWVNLWLTRGGLELLGAPGLETLPVEFREGMAARQQSLGDVDQSDPATWVAPFTGGTEPHAAVVIASDTLADLADRQARVEELLARHGASIIGRQVGEGRQGEFRGREHFGFKDGISQPGIERFTRSSKSGTVAAGEFLIGYRDADGNVSGQPPTNLPTPNTPTGYDPTPPPPLPAQLPAWTHNSSFVVYRRLRQDVAAFQQAMTDQAGSVGLTSSQLAAKLVGRWPSGAPMEHVPGCPASPDPSAEDPSIGCPAALDNNHINKFDYSDDPDGSRVPRAAHIRKMNPRADVLADGDTSGRHRMLRRGLSYGPEFQTGETPYGQTVPDTQDRGLLFVAFQSSIARAFEFVQTKWANRDDFQRPGDGKDPLIAQDTANRAFLIPPNHQMTFAAWVFTTGGAYFIAPSLTGLTTLCDE